MDTFTTSQVAERFGVSHQTVKNWSKEFAEYLSSTAAPEEQGTKRAFTSEDVDVLAVVHELGGRGRDNGAAHAALRAGQRGAQSALMVRNDRDTLIATQRERDMLQGAVIELRAALKNATSDRDELLQRLHRAETMLDLYETGRLQPRVEQ